MTGMHVEFNNKFNINTSGLNCAKRGKMQNNFYTKHCELHKCPRKPPI